MLEVVLGCIRRFQLRSHRAISTQRVPQVPLTSQVQDRVIQGSDRDGDLGIRYIAPKDSGLWYGAGANRLHVWYRHPYFGDERIVGV